MQMIIILIDIWGGRSAEIGGAENRVKHLSQASSILWQVIDIIDFTLMKRGCVEINRVYRKIFVA